MRKIQMALGLVLAGAASSALGAVSYTTPGSTYNQNFDSLVSSATASWANDTTLPGWYWYDPGDTTTSGSTVVATPATYTATNGSSSIQIAVLSLGSASTDTGTHPSSERALGSQTHAGADNERAPIYYGVQLTNNTGSTLDNFSVAYNAEVWRLASNLAAPDRYVVEYQIFNSGAGSINASSGWTDITGADYSSTVTSATATAVDGNSAADQTAKSGSVSSISWNAGQELWVRWTDEATDSGGTNSSNLMMGIDDVNISTSVPEPASISLIGAALLVLSRRRTRSI